VRDGASHRVRAEAPGFDAKRELVTFDSDTATVNMVLEPSKGEPNKNPKAAVGAARNTRPNPRSNPPTPPPVVAVPPQPVPGKPESPKTETPPEQPKKPVKPALIDQNDDPWKK